LGSAPGVSSFAAGLGAHGGLPSMMSLIWSASMVSHSSSTDAILAGAVGYFQAAGYGPRDAYQATFGGLSALQVMSWLWFARRN
jgi:hypothetical protein